MMPVEYGVVLVGLAGCGVGLVFLALCKKGGMSYYQGGIVIALMAIGGSVLYWQWGGASSFIHVKAREVIADRLGELSQKPDLRLHQVLARLEELSETVKDSHWGLAKLSELYIELGHPTESAALLERAMTLAPTQEEYAIKWIYQQSVLHNGKLPENARKLAESLLTQPDHRFTGMTILAMDDYFKENYLSAKGRWEFILENDHDITPERRAVLERALANVSAKIGAS